MPLASGSPALTEEAAKDNVAAMSAAEMKREYRAPDVALMHCDFFGYIWGSKLSACQTGYSIVTCSYLVYYRN